MAEYIFEINDTLFDEETGELVMRPKIKGELIRCKDCKYYYAYDYTGYLACHFVVGGTVRRKSDDFCSCAKRGKNDE